MFAAKVSSYFLVLPILAIGAGGFLPDRASAAPLECDTEIEFATPLNEAYDGIRPGAMILAEPGTGFGFNVPSSCWQASCTLNFVFTDDSWGTADERLYIGTAGHCVGLGQFSGVCVRDCFYGKAGHLVGLASGRAGIGPVVFTTGAADPGADFALIEIPRNHHSLVRYTVPFWDGPAAATCPDDLGMDGSEGVPERLTMFYGNGLGFEESGAASRARTGLLKACPAPGDNALLSLAPAVWGDSGAPLLVQNVVNGEPGLPSAVGIITHINGGGITIEGAKELVQRSTGLEIRMVCGAPSARYICG